MPDLATTATLLATTVTTAAEQSALVKDAANAAATGGNRFISLIGFVVFISIGLLLCNNKRRINWRPVALGFVLQACFAILVLGIPAIGFKLPGVAEGISAFSRGFYKILDCTIAGSSFIFGPLVSDVPKNGFIFAFQVLPTIIFFSSLMAVAYYLGIMQFIVRMLAIVMQRFLGTSGAETLSASANIFVGQTEAPLMIRPYVGRMTQSELFCVMVGGMATVSGGVMAAYALMLRDRVPEIAGHLLTASVMAAPAALAMSKLILPEVEEPVTRGTSKLTEDPTPDANIIEAAARGAGDGLSLALNVAAMLLAFIGLIALINMLLGLAGGWIGFETWGANLVPEIFRVSGQAPALSLEVILGWLFWPVAFIMGIPTNECAAVGTLLGQKMVLNEFVAFSSLVNIGGQLSDRSVILASYALCGFANFSSIAIQIGGIGGIAPHRRGDLARLGIRCVIAGSMTSFMTATIAGFLM